MAKGKAGSCKVCENSEAETIRREAVIGSVINTAKKYKMSQQTVDKCIKNHKPQELRQSVGLIVVAPEEIISSKEIEKQKEYANNKIVSIATKEGWNQEVQNYMAQIESELDKLRKAGQSNQYTQLGHVKTKLLELAGKAAGVFSPDTAIQINNFLDSDDYKKLKQVIILALIPYPEAAVAVAEAIESAGL